MPQIYLSKTFEKNYRKRIGVGTKVDKKFKERLNLFLKNSLNPVLKDHALKGELYTYRAFSITGDIRVIYEVKDDGYRLIDIGSHAQVYKM